MIINKRADDDDEKSETITRAVACRVGSQRYRWEERKVWERKQSFHAVGKGRKELIRGVLRRVVTYRDMGVMDVEHGISLVRSEWYNNVEL